MRKLLSAWKSWSASTVASLDNPIRFRRWCLREVGCYSGYVGPRSELLNNSSLLMIA